MPKAKNIPILQQSLLNWYAVHQRDLPWRRTRDPYAVWISEMMLQQTQVATVIPYYERWMKRFPNVVTLARARLQTVLKLWEGLGYYSRARHLHAAAKIIVADHRGQVPHRITDLRKLPGIGPYTAGAIASIAFDADEPVLDGNVTRVLCRMFRITTPPKDIHTQQKLWHLAHQLIPTGKAGFFNQAMMDLGATICLSRKPLCEQCPWRTHCRARAKGEQNQLPVKTPARLLPHFDIAVGVVWKNGKILIGRRKPKGLLGGLWEFPGGKRKSHESLKACVIREIKEETGIDVEVNQPLITVKHAYSHFRITLHVFTCRWRAGRARPLDCTAVKWVTPRQLDAYPFPRANLKVIEALKNRSS
ncbi:MAG: A/G-specific adenine glycosylase [Sedimentisphaerales bacterium]|nr:A/G-specific adenine glycosylase [Sedimentisphaerales bacterium]